MKYTTEVTINVPRQRVVELFDNPENMLKWQPSLKSFEALEGSPGQPGAKSRLMVDMGRGPVEMIETVTRRNLPDELSGTYEMAGVWNQVDNRFYDEGGGTRWVAVNEFKFSGLMMSVIGLLMPGSFRKETAATMARFKQFAESA